MTATLLSVIWIVPVIWLGYTMRAWWIARVEWTHFSTDTKAFYLLVAPPIALAIDVLFITDRMFYWPRFRSDVSTVRPLTVGRAIAILATFSLLSDTAVAAERVAPEDTIPVVKQDEPVVDTNTSEVRPPYLSPSEASSIQYRELQLEAIDSISNTEMGP